MYCYTESCNIAEITLKTHHTICQLEQKEMSYLARLFSRKKSQSGSQVVIEKVVVLSKPGCQRKSRGIVVARLSKKRSMYCHGQVVKEKVEVLS